MLPGLRILLAAVFMTAIVINLVVAVLMSAPGESLIDAVAFPRIEHPLQQARTAIPKQQSRMPGFATALSSSAPGARMMDGGTSTYAKRLGPAESEAVRPAEDSSTQSVDPAVTSSVSSPSIVTGKPSPPVGVASAGVQNQVAHKCGPCSWDDRRYRRIGFRGFGRRPHVSSDRNSYF